MPCSFSLFSLHHCLQCKAARCSDVAAAIRRQLAQAIPTRLLLAPLMANLEVAAEVGSPCALFTNGL
jgi:hypothetical protein